ncbi:MAG: 50S ribosomal protein L11 methyltransferase [Ruminococcaceae bacterium]|nr:50S ribosomal protein L11 methyltransferase [Oscillospiraceae bacterium]
MEWIALKIFTSREGIEPLCGRLYCLGVGGVQIEESSDFEEFIETNTPHWDYIDPSLDYLRDCETCVMAWLTADEAGYNQLALIREGVAAMKAMDTEGSFGALRIELQNRDDKEWADNWKQYYKPFELGERVLVRPEWEKIEDSHGRIVLTMNPGHLFGTGTHYSTRMCMERLEKYISGGERVLDLGCGSGILAILALLLGADNATCVDIDAGAPGVVAENAALNDIPNERCRVVVGNVLDDETLSEPVEGQFDLVVANIVADVIIALAPAAYAYTKTNGTFITSGIIEEREEPVAQALRDAGFVIKETQHQGGWTCFVCSK